MKKSVKEEVEEILMGSMYMRRECIKPILARCRRACKEAYERGWRNSTFGGDDKRTQDVVSEIINGPKKARGK